MYIHRYVSSCVGLSSSHVYIPTAIQIHVEHPAVVEEGATVEDIEQAALEAERMAQEAQKRAADLRQRARRARRSLTPKEDSD